MRNTVVLFLALFVLERGPLAAQEVTNFELVNVMDNKTVSLSDFASSPGVVLIFTSNSCPYDEYYRTRIAALARQYQGRVPLLLVNAHTEPEESMERMVEKGGQLKLSVPYLADKDQVLMRVLGVRKSPEAFLLRNNNGKFSVVYRGALDDNAQVEADVRHHHLRNAVDLMLKNAKVEPSLVRPVGCNVRTKS